MSKKLYHGTDNVYEVLTVGLVANYDRNFDASREGFVYLTDVPETALEFGKFILEVLPPKPELLQEGNEHIELIYPEYIPPTHIRPYTTQIKNFETAEILPENSLIEREKLEDMMPWAVNKIDIREYRAGESY